MKPVGWPVPWGRFIVNDHHEVPDARRPGPLSKSQTPPMRLDFQGILRLGPHPSFSGRPEARHPRFFPGPLARGQIHGPGGHRHGSRPRSPCLRQQDSCQKRPPQPQWGLMALRLPAGGRRRHHGQTHNRRSYQLPHRTKDQRRGAGLKPPHRIRPAHCRRSRGTGQTRPPSSNRLQLGAPGRRRNHPESHPQPPRGPAPEHAHPCHWPIPHGPPRDRHCPLAGPSRNSTMRRSLSSQSMKRPDRKGLRPEHTGFDIHRRWNSARTSGPVGGHKAAAGLTILTENIPGSRPALKRQPWATPRKSSHPAQRWIWNCRWTWSELADRRAAAARTPRHGKPAPVLWPSGRAVRRKKIFGKDRNHLRLCFDSGWKGFSGGAPRCCPSFARPKKAA